MPISTRRRYCDGLTEDGCQMVFDEVETMEGDLVANASPIVRAV